MSIKAMEEEISNQALDLPRFASQLRKEHLPKLKPSSFVFAGSGDSYAAALFAQELSQGEAVASDPYELLTNIHRVRGKNLVIVSVSGRTRTNIKLAKKAKHFAISRIAITANPESPLAKECDSILPLEYRTPGILTSGTISFTASLLACSYLIQGLPPTVLLESAIGEANAWAKGVKLAENGSQIFIGSGVNFALALYGASKIQEILGTRAEAVYPEQLGHSKLFTINRKRDVIICISSGRGLAVEVSRLLRDDGFQTLLLKMPEREGVNGSLKIAIRMQALALALANKRQMEEVAFLSDPERLRLSNRLIYDSARRASGVVR